MEEEDRCMEYSFTIGLFVVISIATVGHYILESIKVRLGNGSGTKGYNGGLLVSKDELSRLTFSISRKFY